MNIELLGDSEAVAGRAASIIVDYASDAITARGAFFLAVSGGRTPWAMLRRVAAAPIPWRAVHIIQVDERVAPAGHTERNLTHLRESLAEAAVDSRKTELRTSQSAEGRAHSTHLPKNVGHSKSA